MTEAEYIADVKASRAAAQKQLDQFKKGMRFFTNGVERTDAHIKHLTKVVESYDKLLEAIGA